MILDYNLYSQFGIYFILTLVFGYFWIKEAQRIGIGEYSILSRFKNNVRKHFKDKEGTATIGGVIIFISLTIFGLFNQNPIYFSIIGIGALLFVFGAFDDVSKILRKDRVNFSIYKKVVLHLLVGAVFCLVFYFSVSKSIPYFIFNACFFVFFVNAFNVSDGLDGMAIGNFIIALILMSIGFYYYENYALLKLCVVLLGMSFAFLAFNWNPAKIFMGDAGASMLGGILAMIAIFGKLKALMFFAGMFFVLEGASSFIQVFGKEFLRRKILPFACPIHHYFINKGVDERKIVVLSWIFSILSGIIGLYILGIYL